MILSDFYYACHAYEDVYDDDENDNDGDDHDTDDANACAFVWHLHLASFLPGGIDLLLYVLAEFAGRWGLPTIRELCKKGDDHQYVERLSKKWLAADWRKKTYDTNISLASLVPENNWSLGALPFLMRWRSYIP